MYLVSIYFDEKANKKIQQYIDAVAERTGNRFMVDGNVPPHITVSAFETLDEGVAVEALQRVTERIGRGKILWASVGQFFPYVLFLTPVLNCYLHNMSDILYEEFSEVDGLQFSPYYLPFQWQPHTTIGKKLSKEEMKVAFDILQDSFGVFEGEVVRIGLAKPNPHRDIVSFELK